jgi:hypothetical protein
MKLETVNHFPHYSFMNGSTALCWALASSSVGNHVYADGRTPWTSGRPIARPLPTHMIERTDIRPFTGILTHDASFRVGKDSSCLRPRGHCDRPSVSRHCRYVRRYGHLGCNPLPFRLLCLVIAMI